MEITNNKILYLIDKEIEIRKENRIRNAIQGMTDQEILKYRERILKQVNRNSLTI